MIKKLRKGTKGNNKGFSMVELIVVILIIAILGVAVAPQIMKWVGGSRVSSDKNNAAGLQSSIIVAVADYQGKGNPMPTGAATFIINGNGNTVPNEFKTEIEEVLGGKYPKTQDDTNGFTVTITTMGAVTVSCGALAK